MTAPAEDWLAPSLLIELGEQAIAVVAAEIAEEAPLVRCQLLASDFYEAWKQQYGASENDARRRDLLTAAGVHCCRMRTAAISPARMLEELQAAVGVLRSDAPAAIPPKKSPPVLR